MPPAAVSQFNPISSPSRTTQALDILKHYLPEALPLYRRIQFGRFFDATRIYTNVDFTNPALYSRQKWDDPGTAPFWMAFVDRSCRPETEVWFFGSWEACPPPSDNGSEKGREAWKVIDGMVSDLLSELSRELRTSGVPHSVHQEILEPPTRAPNGSDRTTRNAAPTSGSHGEDRDTGGYSRSDYAGHSAHPNIMLWGAVHEGTVPVLQRLGVLSQAHKAGFDPNHTFIFSLDALPPLKPLPSGLEWGTVQPKHFALVRSRTQIPRQERTMAVLPSLAIYPTDTDTSSQEAEPIAWAFVGIDGSLTTLHVEAPYRGRGLAKAVATKLFLENMHAFWQPDTKKVAHAYVQEGNTSSEHMCRSLGGTSEWLTYWLRVDLEKVTE